ncbi:SiaC family regulatory phosphoprotein [Pseudoduganella lutea]|uniref:DUF1987 domain-containing protein n=1 Tax=Pseudoduganella lutea TaxID=321985 RepID=A0A4P6L2X8_9BURK|nr:SiaC family regulatory phosphoprotein [Pseudoduganella lutea]QBE65920.1 DUF1987 domain-containing protein [Pseudoduganella lutea]
MPLPLFPFPRQPAASPAAGAPCATTFAQPTAVLDTACRRLTLIGASCLDDAIAFYGPLIGRLRACLDRRSRDAFDVDIALSTVDMGSEKMLFALFDTLHEGALAGNSIAIRWQRQGTDRRCKWFFDTLRERFPLLRFTDCADHA